MYEQQNQFPYILNLFSPYILNLFSSNLYSKKLYAPLKSAIVCKSIKLDIHNTKFK